MIRAALRRESRDGVSRGEGNTSSMALTGEKGRDNTVGHLDIVEEILSLKINQNHTRMGREREVFTQNAISVGT